MSAAPQFVDLSEYQPAIIDWQAYKQWSAQVDGISRVALRTSYGTGFTDKHFQSYRAGALAAGIDVIYYYHYSYPHENSALAEANWQHTVVGEIRDQDLLVLDFEENVVEATSTWALAWLSQQTQNYGGKVPGLYASDAYIRARLQDTALSKYPLWLADWTFDPGARPPCPSPWQTYTCLQYSDNATTIPGVAGTVDVNIYLGGDQNMGGIPIGWHDDGTTLTAPNGLQVVLGFRQHILTHQWSSDNFPIELEHEQSPLEISNVALGKGTQQLFRLSMLGYTPALGVFEEYLGVELLALRAQMASIPNLPALKALIASQQQGLAQIAQIAKQFEAS